MQARRIWCGNKKNEERGPGQLTHPSTHPKLHTKFRTCTKRPNVADVCIDRSHGVPVAGRIGQHELGGYTCGGGKTKGSAGSSNAATVSVRRSRGGLITNLRTPWKAHTKCWANPGAPKTLGHGRGKTWKNTHPQATSTCNL